MKLCIECLHYLKNENYNDLCLHPELSRGFDCVRGERRPVYCEVVRATGQCGPEGKLWEAK